MLANFPDPETPVRLIRDVSYQLIRYPIGRVGTLVRAFTSPGSVDHPTDRFLINIDGRHVEVMRADIEQVGG